MKRLCLLVIMFCSLGFCRAQNAVSGDTVVAQLMHLKFQKRFVPKYVNFDVLKIMISGGVGADKSFNYRVAPSVNVQLLWPFPLFKTTFPIAYGLNVGYTKMSIKNSKLNFSNNELITIDQDPNVEYVTQRVRYIGAVLLRAIRIHAYTFLIGGSLNYNINGKLKTVEAGNKSRSSDLAKINRISIPLKIQISRSPRQLWSAGIFCSYDTKARFNGNEFKKLKQLNAGISFAVIL